MTKLMDTLEQLPESSDACRPELTGNEQGCFLVSHM